MKANNGFTLIEMMVVLVLMALTTTLLTEGLSTTWRNFERLGARDLSVSSSHLPVTWFRESVEGALLFHPETINARGDEDTFAFVTFSSPDSLHHSPRALQWEVRAQQNVWALGFIAGDTQVFQPVSTFEQKPSFRFWAGGSWQRDFNPDRGRLPKAISVVVNDQVWALSVIGRPEYADVPPEYATFGIYEF